MEPRTTDTVVVTGHAEALQYFDLRLVRRCTKGRRSTTLSTPSPDVTLRNRDETELIELYPEIKLIHATAALASGILFLLRGTAVNWGGSWGMIAPVRYMSYTIDTVLLTAALLLLASLPTTVYSNGWLWLKLMLLFAYIGFGTLALKRGRTVGIRRGCFIAAVATFTCMYLIARTHDPLGPVRFLLAPFR